MAPTASTTAALSLGDALAVALMIRRGFKKEDFLRHHPAGSLGERLNLKVRDMMLDRKSAPEVSKGDKIRDVIAEINKLNLGFTLVTESDTLLGIITDGDIRRALEHDDLILLRKASDLMTSNPLVITEDQTAAEALEIMERKLITALAVVQDSGKLSGIIHLHDLLGRGQIRFSQ
jgi:arabinose-5-phosphate isomerase